MDKKREGCVRMSKFEIDASTLGTKVYCLFLTKVRWGLVVKLTYLVSKLFDLYLVLSFLDTKVKHKILHFPLDKLFPVNCINLRVVLAIRTLLSSYVKVFFWHAESSL